MFVRAPSFLLLIPFMIPAVTAQDQSTPDPEVQPPPQTDPAHAPKRLFGIFPNYQAADASKVYVHPTVQQKFAIAGRNTFDWPNIFINAGFALQTQVAQNGFQGPAFGRTFAEYYARTWADSLIGNYTTQAILPSMLGEDPRYIRMGTGSGWRRTWHAVSWVAITKGTNGKNRIHLSSLGGNVGVIAVTNLYYPNQHDGFGASAARWGLSLGDDAIANLLTEFLPDIERKLRRH